MQTILLISFGLFGFEAAMGDDAVITQCVSELGGVKRPSVHPRFCSNTYADVPCAYLYPIVDNSSNLDASKDFLVSENCHSGPLQPYASSCASQCAICCEKPEFNCTERLEKEKCNLFSDHGLCQGPELQSFLNFHCRQTCGLCLNPEFNGTFCKDEYSQCNMLFGLVPCTSPFMQKNCKGTCMLSENCAPTPSVGPFTITIPG